MARAVILGNSGLTVGLNESGLVHDFYYPYVGLENLTTARLQPHKVGIWVDGQFSWIDEQKWEKTIDFQNDALVSEITMINMDLEIKIHFNDFVDFHLDVFAREVIIENLRSEKREVKIFFHQVFQISALGRSDTVMYVPEGNYILDYKGRCSILAYAETAEGVGFDQYAAGNAGIEGKEGTFRDAEDGELSMSAVEHGGVDSTIRVSFNLEPRQSQLVRYWLAVADSQQGLEKIHEQMIGSGFARRLSMTKQHWRSWLAISQDRLNRLDLNHQNIVKKSLMVIKAHSDEHGGVIASCDSSIYNYGRDYYSYVWPRDGAYVMWPLIKLGYQHEPKAFFRFCKSIMHKDGYLMHKYQPDRAIGSTWHPLVHGKRKELAIQEDETAIVVYMLGEYFKHNQDLDFLDEMYESLIKPASDFMGRFIDVSTGLPHASYDLWEEKFLTSTYSTAVTYGGLMSAVSLANAMNRTQDANSWYKVAERIKLNSLKFYDQDNNYLVKGFLNADNQLQIDKTLDVSSFYGAWMFGYGSKNETSGTVYKIETSLLDHSPSGGTPRYENDGYFVSDPKYKGNPWFVTTLWMSQYYSSIGKNSDAMKYIDWATNLALPSGVLSEQVKPENGEIVGVTPLVWSHAELVNAIISLYYQ